MNTFTLQTSTKTLAFTLGLAIAAGGCASPGKKTAIGAGAGGATGAAVGGATGGWKGAAIGAAVGAAVGGAYGNLLDKREQELNEVAETRKTENGLLVNLKNDLLFNTDSAELKPEAIEQLDQLGSILGKYPDDKITIQGFTDDRGPDAYNQTLSMRRAASVRKVLDQKGVKESQMRVRGYGEEHPVATNKSEAGRAGNRRVELKIDVPNKQAQG